MSVLRLIPNVRQTAALLAPPSSAVITAVSFSVSIVRIPTKPPGYTERIPRTIPI
jgi:hypothetical protein